MPSSYWTLGGQYQCRSCTPGRWRQDALRLTHCANLLTACESALESVGPLDGLVLSLHGALAAVGTDAADLALLRAAREALGPRSPISLCLDLHANVTKALVSEVTSVIGYHTYPHVDVSTTGSRAADLLVDAVTEKRKPVTRLARKRALLLPAEGQLPEGPLGTLRAMADRLMTRAGVLDVSLFPVQPWLDVEELGLGVTVTTDNDPELAQRLAEDVADRVWTARDEFRVELTYPQVALARARQAKQRPVLLVESADSPTGGATGDSPAMVQALLSHATDLRAYETVVDPQAVTICQSAGEGASVSVEVGATLDRRFHPPVATPLSPAGRRPGSDPAHR